MVETTRFAIFRSQAGRETPFIRLIMEDGESSDDSVAGRQALPPRPFRPTALGRLILQVCFNA